MKPYLYQDAAMSPITVLYDQSCPICRLLASLLTDEAPAHWEIKAWQLYSAPIAAPQTWHEARPSELRIVTKEHFLEGEAAWEYMMKEIPSLNKYQAIAAKIGLTPAVSAKWLRLLGHGIRNLCFSCSWSR